MGKAIDCLFVGHNEMDFLTYEEKIRQMGVHTGAFRDLNLNYIWYNNKPYSASDIFNLFHCCKNGNKPLTIGETFNAAIAYLGTYLHRRGFTFDYVNAFREEKEELKRKLLQDNILSIAIITTLYVSAFPIIEIIDFIKKYNREVRIIVGGPFVTSQFRVQDSSSFAYLLGTTLGADFYINSSQGEAALVELLNALKNRLPFDHINNLYYKSDKGCISTPISRENNKLSENMVDWTLFADRMGAFANIRTSISCPFSCAFCGFPQHAGRYQVADVESIKQELNQLERIETLEHIHFIDDTFNVPVKRFKNILRMIIKNKFRFKWYSHFRCQFADREMVELMKESGCEGVFLGIESGNDQILKNMNKAATEEKYLKGIQLLKEYQILNYGSFIIGFPGETEKTVQDTIQFIRESRLEFYRAQLWYCEPITPIWQQREKYKIEGERFEWSHGTMDSKHAADLVDEIFLSIDDPIWVPQYNFECDALFHFFPRGFTMEEVKTFLKMFNDGVREKIKTSASQTQEVSFDVIKRLERFFKGSREPDEPPVSENRLTEKYTAAFDL
jgi:radical SAM PhpK family P-methyltransferase